MDIDVALHNRGRSSVWLERRPVTSEVAGSNPVVPAKLFNNFQTIFCAGEVIGFEYLSLYAAEVPPFSATTGVVSLLYAIGDATGAVIG